MLLLELFYFLQAEKISRVDIIEISIMLSSASQSSSKFHSFFNKENTRSETETKLDFVSYIWDDDHIMRLDEKTGNTYALLNYSR